MTGEPFADWVKQRIFVPLKLWDTFSQSDCFALIPGRAEAYRAREGGFVRDHQINVDVAGQSHVFSTIEDMLRWVDNFRSRELGGKMPLQTAVHLAQLVGH